jgi:hypothetical protein
MTLQLVKHRDAVQETNEMGPEIACFVMDHTHRFCSLTVVHIGPVTIKNGGAKFKPMLLLFHLIQV